MTPADDEREREGLLGVFMQFRAALARAVGRIVHSHDVEDIVQEAFVRCYEASRTTDIRHPRSFLLTTARNLALNHVVRADNKLADRVASFDESSVPMYAPPLEADAEEQEQFLLLCRAVNELPVQCRRAFILKKVYGLSRKEIAEYLDITESTVQKHVAKGLLLCTEYLEKSGYPQAASPRQRRADSAE
ncbi:MAG TPA: RNA polymerase sigma factor [Gammaproteobacteria bacterium]